MMANMTGQKRIIPAYCYPRYDYLSERADTLIKYFEGIEVSAKFRRCLNRGEEKYGSIIRNGKTLKSTLNLFVFYKKEDSDFLETNQFLVKDVDKEEETEHVAISWEEFLERTKTTKDVDLSTVVIIVLSGKLSEALEEVKHSTKFKELPQQHTYFVSKEESECCKIENITEMDQWTSDLGHLVQSGLEKTVMEVVKQLEQFVAELLPGKGAHIQDNIMDFLQKHLEDWLGNKLTFQPFSSMTQSQGPERTSKTSEGELNTIFRKMMQDSISRETKIVVLDGVTKYTGLNPSFTNHFFENKLNFEDALQKAITTMPEQSYTDLRMDYKNAFKMVSSDYKVAIINIIEPMVTNLMVILERMRSLQFVTLSLLRQSPLTCKDFMVPPKMPKKLQQDLLIKPFVTGCGTIFGKLVIHVKSAISGEQKDDIGDCLKRYNYLFPCKVEVFVPVHKKTAGQGDCIRAEKLTPSDDDRFQYGSLGCFVDVKFKERDRKEVHFITCYHCLNGCSKTVSIRRRNGEYEDFGDFSGELSNDLQDIALVQVTDPRFISKGLKRVDDEREFVRWQFGQEGDNLAGRQIYMVGAASGKTKGLIASDDYKTIHEIDKLPPDAFLIVPECVFAVPVDKHDGSSKVGLERCAKTHQPGECPSVFSKDGDSGSVVYDKNPDTGHGLVLGLLQGALVLNSRVVFSYASCMAPALNRLKDKHPDIVSIEPSLT